MIKQQTYVIGFADRLLSKAILSETIGRGIATARLYAQAAERFKTSGDVKQAESSFLKAAEIAIQEQDRELFRKYAVEAVTLDLELMDLIKAMVRNNEDAQRATELEGVRYLAIVKRDYEERHRISATEQRVRKTLDVWSFKIDWAKELLLIKSLAAWEYMADLTLDVADLAVDKAYAMREWFWETVDRFLG